MHEQVLAQIENKILDGRLRPGAKLPSERELADALGVSRTSVREALRVLESLGILDAQTGSGRDSGSTIMGRPTPALSNLLRLHVALSQISLGDLVDIRKQLETNAAHGAAQHASHDELAHLKSLLTSMRTSELRTEEFNELDTEFHVSIARCSHNVLAADLMQALRDALKTQMTATFGQLSDWHHTTTSLIDEHEQIVNAIENGDGDGASVLMDKHITNFYNDQLQQ